MAEAPGDRRRVVVVGNTTVDCVFQVGASWQKGGKTVARSFGVFAGGQAANVAVTLGGLGLLPHFIGVFGSDAAADLSRRSLVEAGCDLEGSVTVPDCPQHIAAIVVSAGGGERSLVEYKDPRLSRARLELEPRWLERAAAVYLDGQEPDVAIRVARAARAAGVRVVADLEHSDERFRGFVSELDEVIAPREVLAALVNEAEDARIVRRTIELGPEVVVATAGEGGCLGALGRGAPIFVPAAPANAIDTTGAGDAFHAAYLAACLFGRDLGEALSFAARVAAAKCEHIGPRLPAHALEPFRRELSAPLAGEGTGEALS